MVSSCDGLFCNGLQAATYGTVGRCDKRGDLALKSKSVRGLPTRNEDPESAHRCSMDNYWLYYHQGTLVL
jgi:hypothetical protein